MSRFYGMLQGSRGEATRQGTPQSGLTTHTAGWQGAVRVRIYDKDGVDTVHVELVPWRGVGGYRTLYEGRVDGQDWWPGETGDKQ